MRENNRKESVDVALSPVLGILQYAEFTRRSRRRRSIVQIRAEREPSSSAQLLYSLSRGKQRASHRFFGAAAAYYCESEKSARTAVVVLLASYVLYIIITKE